MSIEMVENKKIFGELENDLLSIYNYCNEQSLSSDDLTSIVQPLKTYLQRKTIKFPRLLFIFLIVSIVAFGASRLEPVSWNITALSRIALIQTLSIWDWRYLHKNQCLIPKKINDITDVDAEFFNCNMCEHLSTVDRIGKNVSPNLLHERYLNMHEPIIVAANDFVAVNITEFLLHDNNFLDTIPCDLATNLFSTQDIWMDKIIERITNPIYSNWFVHFRNCELVAVKYLRLLRPRAEFLPYSLPRTHTNWIVLSKDYNGKVYKSLNFEQNVLILFEQVDGSNFIELKPRDHCVNVCDSLKFQLNAGDYLIYISKLWELKYKGNSEGFNAAVAEEIYWD